MAGLLGAGCYILFDGKQASMSDKEPIFKSIFGSSWESLPDVMKKHYANRPNSDDRVEVIGKIDTFCAGPIKWMSSLF